MDKRQIKQILLEQKEEIKEIIGEKIIEREVENYAKQSLKNRLIKVIIGARRSGKSFLAHKILEGKNYGYVNFDDERFIGVKSRDLNDFLEEIKEIDSEIECILLDEIQNIDGWELFVNRLKRAGYNAIVTGSNAKLLSQELATHLTGRHTLIELYPFSFGEFLKRKGQKFSENDFYLTAKKANIKRLLEEYMDQGGFPELFLLDNKKQYLRDLYDKIISRDIVPRHKIKYVKSLKELALYLISNFGSKFTFQKLAKLFNIKSVHTAKNYIDYLEEVYMLFVLEPFSFKIKERISAPKKVYAIDTGLINAISFQNSPNRGRLMENIVFLELKRRGKEIYYYIDRTGREIDFLIKNNRKVEELIQVCFDLNDIETRDREIRALENASGELNCKNLTVITWDDEREEIIKKRKIIFKPLYKWLLGQ